MTLPSVDAEITAKVELVMRADEAARAYDPRIREVRASYGDELRNILVVGSDGTFAEDSQPLARMNVSCIAKTEGNSARGSAGGGGRVALDFFFGEKTPEYFAKEAARQAILQLDAREAPAGEMEVVLGPGWPGVLLHEAVGHGLEADFNRKKTSAFAGLIGKRVASEKCTVVDNGTMPWRRGSLNVDDEGNPTQETVLIEKGILKGYLSDKLSARLMGMANTGNGRRESYEHIPMPRMTNTYMLAGQDDPQDIIRSVKRGMYAVNFGGGQVDITNGKFVFSASEAYLIEDGQITAPIKGATLIGDGPDVLTRVSMVGNDLKLDEGVGTCGKDGQAVPVGVGIPTHQNRPPDGGRDGQERDRRIHAVSTFFAADSPRTNADTSSKQIMSSTQLETRNQKLETDLRELAQDIVRRAMAGGATAAECVVREGDEFSTLVRLGQVETLKESGSKAIGVRVFNRTARRQHLFERFLTRRPRPHGEVGAGTFEDHLGRSVRRHPRGVATGVDCRQSGSVLSDVYSLPGEERISYARRAEKAALDFDPRIKNSEGGSFDAATGHKVLANSHGFVGEYRRSYCSVAAVPIAQNENGAMQRDYWFSVARNLGRLDAPEHVGKSPHSARLRRLGARKGKTAHVPVMLDPLVAASMLDHIFEGVNGDSVYRGASFLAGKLGAEDRRRPGQRH